MQPSRQLAQRLRCGRPMNASTIPTVDLSVDLSVDEIHQQFGKRGPRRLEQTRRLDRIRST